ncbi:MAG: J domain-containing protein [Deltaproteobacteria bacterium]|nr:J domain-containing protein [Deltaproteobacteria bacterium]
MDTYQKINEARTLLELPEKATMEEIKSNYRDLIQKWHPDRCKKSKEKCTEMTTRIIAAYEVICDYCRHYRFSFSQKEVKNYLSDEEWWLDRFGQSSLWGEGEKPD